jgi:hypothetical protein
VSTRGKLGRRAGALTLAGTLALVGATVGATAANASTYRHSWYLEAGSNAIMNTHSVTTNSSGKISSCVSVTKIGATGGVWSFQLTWRGQVLWHSGDHEGTGRICSPVKKPGRGKNIYDHIIVINTGPNPAVQDWGNYTLDNY